MIGALERKVLALKGTDFMSTVLFKSQKNMCNIAPFLEILYDTSFRNIYLFHIGVAYNTLM
jgi:hypothetical protein